MSDQPPAQHGDNVELEPPFVGPKHFGRHVPDEDGGYWLCPPECPACDPWNDPDLADGMEMAGPTAMHEVDDQ